VISHLPKTSTDVSRPPPQPHPEAADSRLTPVKAAAPEPVAVTPGTPQPSDSGFPILSPIAADPPRRPADMDSPKADQRWDQYESATAPVDAVKPAAQPTLAIAKPSAVAAQPTAVAAKPAPQPAAPQPMVQPTAAAPQPAAVVAQPTVAAKPAPQPAAPQPAVQPIATAPQPAAVVAKPTGVAAPPVVVANAPATKTKPRKKPMLSPENARRLNEHFSSRIAADRDRLAELEFRKPAATRTLGAVPLLDTSVALPRFFPIIRHHPPEQGKAVVEQSASSPPNGDSKLEPRAAAAAQSRSPAKEVSVVHPETSKPPDSQLVKPATLGTDAEQKDNAASASPIKHRDVKNGDASCCSVM
jgi:hypothetical protein